MIEGTKPGPNGAAVWFRGPRWGLVAGFVLALVFVTAAAVGAELTVEVRGLNSDAGSVHFGLYDDPLTFPDADGRKEGTNVPAADGRAVAVFKGLTPGLYAVAVFHDENGNGAFDQGIFGIPLEDYGFSNDATVFFGPPAFEEAAVSLPAEGARITIHLD